MRSACVGQLRHFAVLRINLMKAAAATARFNEISLPPRGTECYFSHKFLFTRGISVEERIAWFMVYTVMSLFPRKPPVISRMGLSASLGCDVAGAAA